MLRTTGENKSKLGIKKVYSTSDPTNPATGGDELAKILNEGFEVLEEAVFDRALEQTEAGKLVRTEDGTIPEVNLSEYAKKNDVVFVSESGTKNITNNVLTTVIKHKAIDPNNGTITDYNYCDAVVMYKLSPNTRYVIEGLGFNPKLLAEHYTLNFYKSTTSERSYGLRNVEANTAFEFTTNDTDLYVSFYIKVYNPSPNEAQNYDSYETLRVYEYPNSLTFVDIEGNILNVDVSKSTSSQGVDIPNTDKNLPKGVSTIKLTGALDGISHDMQVLLDCKIALTDGSTTKCKALVNHQGRSTLVYPEKNFSIDLVDENGKSVKLKIGDWLPFDSYHWKANYTDAMQSRSICCNRILEQMYMTRSVSERRLWNIYNDFEPTSNEARFDTGALGHVDGFAAELYINDEYYGLGTLNIKKSRSNYCMDKNNTNHILLSMAQESYIKTPINWSEWEIKNPKGFEEYKEPSDGVVKTAIIDWFTWAESVNSNTAKEEFEKRLVIPFWLDFRVLNTVFDVIDSYVKNTLLASWDGFEHVAPCSYDLKIIMGLHWQGTSIWRDPQADTDTFIVQPFFSTFGTVFHDEISERYVELRQRGILSVDNIVNTFNQFFLSIGLDNYKKNWKKWPEIPSNRDGSLTYPNQPTSGGFYMDIQQIETWITQRLVYTDEKYGYT